VESAFIEAFHLEGIEGIDVSADWPPAARRYTRVCEAELMVYARDAEIVSLTDDPQSRCEALALSADDDQPSQWTSTRWIRK